MTLNNSALGIGLLFYHPLITKSREIDGLERAFNNQFGHSAPRRWAVGAAAHVSYSLTLIYSAIVILISMSAGDPWFQLLLMALVIPLLAATKGAMRTMAVGDLLPAWKAQLHEWSWAWTVLAPVVPFLFSWNFVASLLTRRIRWRNIRYELVSPSVTRILKR